jgi:hypothetical protein
MPDSGIGRHDALDESFNRRSGLDGIASFSRAELVFWPEEANGCLVVEVI